MKNLKLNLKSAETQYEKLSKNIFPDLNVGFIHGKLKPEDRDLRMKEFKEKYPSNTYCDHCYRGWYRYS